MKYAECVRCACGCVDTELQPTAADDRVQVACVRCGRCGPLRETDRGAITAWNVDRVEHKAGRDSVTLSDARRALDTSEPREGGEG
jgi:hypothetical protein